ncbi:MAG: peroxide stress protein YaaA [Crocinitomicaceae bacterium]|jgi:cytoplasmic iron level regulating protein YaaA (DUF328/UPF0246 family)|nr:peroxide stress protein YaaA [Crocinitomicaceae bacterium]
MKIIISPAKSIQVQSLDTVRQFTTPIFLKETESLVKKLKKMSSKKLQKMMNISVEIADLNVDRFENWELPLKETEVIQPAIASFTGEVYRGLDAASMDAETMNFTQDKLRILSGLYGLLKPWDLMYPYRLEMGTRWAVTPKTKNLYQFWGKKLAQALNEEMNTDEVLVNLASSEYFKAVDRKTLHARMVTPVFKELKNGEYKVVMTYAKNARGRMTRYILENKLQNIEDIKGFDWDGYRFHESLSDENEWVFTR